MKTHAMNLTSPGELIAVVPFLLGFHPRDSLVVVSTNERHLGLIQRLDLPAEAEQVAAVAGLLPPLRAERADSVILIGYESKPAAIIPAIRALTEALIDEGIPVKDRLVVRDGRWRSVDCADPDCCPW